MSESDFRYHLRPVSKRNTLANLRHLEQAYVSQNSCQSFVLHSPHQDLKLVVVVPALNEEKAITKVLSSLGSQEMPPSQYEVIVVDNGSTDQTESLVRRFSHRSDISIHYVFESRKGCLQAVRTGMDVAVHRLSHVCPPHQGVIATIDADDQVGSEWTSAMLKAFAEEDTDLMRGPVQLIQPQTKQVEHWVKLICDVENRVNAYVELARLRIEETLSESAAHYAPLWLPRITGPNIAISKAAYIAVGGLDPRPPGDQASHLATPLLRQGGIVTFCDDPRTTLFRSQRFSQRNYQQAGGLGVGFGAGFGDMLEQATRVEADGAEIIYPNPRKLEDGLRYIIEGLQSAHFARRNEATVSAVRFLKSSPDPNMLYGYGKFYTSSDLVPIAQAREALIEMTIAAGGMDYRTCERFLLGRERLRTAVRTSRRQSIRSDEVVDEILQEMRLSQNSIPPELLELAVALRTLPHFNKAEWYDNACRVVYEFYTRLSLQQIN